MLLVKAVAGSTYEFDGCRDSFGAPKARLRACLEIEERANPRCFKKLFGRMPDPVESLK